MVANSTSFQTNLVEEEELAQYYDKLLKISTTINDENEPEVSIESSVNTKQSKTGVIPPENILDKVPYQPSRGIEPHKLQSAIHRLHSLTTTEMKKMLKEVFLSTQGTKKQLRDRVRRYYRLEYAKYRIEIDRMSGVMNRTGRHFDYLVAIDFECTCVEPMYDYPHEIIEFPAVLIDVKNMKIVDKFRTFVRPAINPILDPFCVQLCGISQKAVDKAPLFPEAFHLFLQWMEKNHLGDADHRFAFVTDGPHDLWKFFQFQCIQTKIDPIPHEFRQFINIKKLFEKVILKNRKLPKGNGLSGIQNMLAHYELDFEGQKHSGLDDAINIARLCILMMKDKIELRINQRMSHRQDKNEERRIEQLIKADKGDGSDFHVWQKKLPLKLRQVSREEFLSCEYLDCETCDETD